MRHVRRGHAASAVVPQEDRVPLKLLAAMFAVIAALGYIVTKDIELPTAAIVGGGIAGLLILLLVGIRRPDIPLYAMVAYLPFSKLLVGDFGGLMMALNLTNLLLVVILLSWFLNAATEGRILFEPHILHLPVFLLTGWALCSFWFTYSQTGLWYLRESISDMKRWLDPIVIYFLFFHVVKTRRRWKTLVVIMMFAVTLAALMALYDYLNVGEGSSLDRARIGGIAGQPNILGAFFVYYMFLFAGFWLQHLKRPRYWLLLVPFAICFRAIMVTFSRGAYLAFAQGAMGLAFFKNKVLFFLAVGAVAFALFNPWLLPEGVQYRLQTTFKDRRTQITDVYGISELEEDLDQSSAIRIIIWRGAGQMIADNPWFGVGLGRFQRYISAYTGGQVKWIDAHNAYIITAAEFGIPALLLFLLTVLVLFRITNVVYKRHPDPFIKATALGFLGGLSGLLMANMFGSRLNTTETSGYFWILAALMARAYVWTRELAAAQTVLPARRRAPSTASQPSVARARTVRSSGLRSSSALGRGMLRSMGERP